MSVTKVGNFLTIVAVVMSSVSNGNKTDNKTESIQIPTPTSLSLQDGGRKPEVYKMVENVLGSLDLGVDVLKVFKHFNQVWLNFLDKLQHPVQSVLELLRLFEVPLPSNVSRQCQKHVRLIFSELLDTFIEQRNPLDEWSLHMIDAIFKPPSGIMRGPMIWPGSFTECVNIVGKDSRDENQKELFVGEHCFASLKFSDIIEKLPLKTDLLIPKAAELIFIQFAMCFPSTCSIKDKNALINSVTSIVKLEVSITDDKCYTNELKQMDVTAIIITMILFIPIAAVVVATFMEFCGSLWMSNGESFWKEKQGQTAYRLLSAFSITNSWKTLNAKAQSPQNNFTFIQGMRYLTICWVIYGHTWIGGLLGGQFKELLGIIDAARNPRTSPLLLAAFFAVDTFFFLSGFCVMYFSLVKAKQNIPSFLKMLLMYPSRYFRLTLSLAFVIAFAAGPWMYMGNGPSWSVVSNMASSCRSDWWKNMLYINNLDIPINSGEMNTCHPIGWYLMVEMQVFLITPPLVYLFIRKPKWAILISVPIYIGLVIIRGYNSAVSGITETHLVKIDIYHIPDFSSRKMFNVYSSTLNRASVYVLGLIFGYYMDVIVQTRIRLKWHMVATGWSICVGMTSAIVYAEYPFIIGTIESTHALRVFWCAMSSSLWCLPLAWVIFACSTGHGELANQFLTWPPFVFLGRLSYSIYLTHSFVGMSFVGMSQSFTNVDAFSTTVQVVDLIVFSSVASLCLYLLIEGPSISIKFFEDKKAKSSAEQEQYDELLDNDTEQCKSSLIGTECTHLILKQRK